MQSNKITRRQFTSRTLKATGAFAALPYLSAHGAESDPLSVNDIHSQLNATRVRAVQRPASSEQLTQIVTQAKEQGRT